MPAAATEPWCVYLLDCEGGRTYLGMSPDPQARLSTHAKGRGSFFTRLNRPMAMVGCVWLPDKRSAAVVERALKQLGPAEKRQWFRQMGATTRERPASLEAAASSLGR